ncbi:MAG: hypothetical protein JWM27_2840 [Gemmatimonadetes bacterium]|nr:hypothetical protein [Gemmatimonadota bacterium]
MAVGMRRMFPHPWATRAAAACPLLTPAWHAGCFLPCLPESPARASHSPGDCDTAHPLRSAPVHGRRRPPDAACPGGSARATTRNHENEGSTLDPRTHSGFTGPAAAARWGGTYDLVCLSHLRWDFVYQRPQHLMSRFARERRVLFVEEPVWGPGPARVETEEREGVRVVRMRLPDGLSWSQVEETQRRLLDEVLAVHGVRRFVAWYYTPMALSFTSHLRPAAVVYDCMDELSLFRGAPAVLLEREAGLLRRADLVFTGGASLYAAKRGRHPGVHLFASSIDAAHFCRARAPLPEPADQAGIPGPRLGYFGVIDERVDLALLAGIAAARPGWQLVMLGPLAKIDAADLPRLPNLHYLGMKAYTELPSYVAGWDVAMLPFALNDATRFISPTKTPEYLAAGRPAISTPIRDVVSPYGERGLVRIAASVDEWVAEAESVMAMGADARASWLAGVDALLAGTSWDRVWAGMRDLVDGAVRRDESRRAVRARQAAARRPAEAMPGEAARQGGGAPRAARMAAAPAGMEE